MSFCFAYMHGQFTWHELNNVFNQTNNNDNSNNKNKIIKLENELLHL